MKDFDIVAAVMLPKRKRRPSEEQKAKLALAGKKYRFAPSPACAAAAGGKVKSTGLLANAGKLCIVNNNRCLTRLPLGKLR